MSGHNYFAAGRTVANKCEGETECPTAVDKKGECSIVFCFSTPFIIPFVTAGSRADEKGVRVAEGRGDYQERAAADSGDETES